MRLGGGGVVRGGERVGGGSAGVEDGEELGTLDDMCLPGW